MGIVQEIPAFISPHATFSTGCRSRVESIPVLRRVDDMPPPSLSFPGPRGSTAFALTMKPSTTTRTAFLTTGGARRNDR